MLHGPEANECACSSETCFTMYSNRSMIRICKVLFNNCKEVPNNMIWWIRAIDEEEIIVRDPSLNKVVSIVFLVV